MKKYKVYFSITNLFNETQKEVVKLQTIAKAIFGTSVLVTWYESNEVYALIIGLAAGLADSALACFYFEEIK